MEVVVLAEALGFQVGGSAFVNENPLLALNGLRWGLGLLSFAGNWAVCEALSSSRGFGLLLTFSSTNPSLLLTFSSTNLLWL